jgi:dTDP-glucose 4,6-dehydratase
MSILVTGGAGFIGANFILNWFTKSDEMVINVDKLTYAGNLNTLKNQERNPNYKFFKIDIADSKNLNDVILKFSPRAIINFAAESHVDKSITSPDAFINTNIIGTYNLLKISLNYFQNLDEVDKKKFRFLHVSTDEVYGTLDQKSAPFNENNQYMPNSPYSASKAASDHLVRAWHHTYGFPTLTTNCSNNYGPYQFPEKLIPLIITNALASKPITIYGDGKQIRDWLHVNDHCDAINQVLTNGRVGDTYNIGGNNEKMNFEVVNIICDILDRLKPREDNSSYKKLIQYISDRPGHDRRYAIDATKMKTELCWEPFETFETGILKTVEWYLKNEEWIGDIKSGKYNQI